MTSLVISRANNYISLTYLYSNENIALKIGEIIENISGNHCLALFSFYFEKFVLVKIWKNFDIGFLMPDSDVPIYFLLIPQISTQYCQYFTNKLLKYNYLLGL